MPVGDQPPSSQPQPPPLAVSHANTIDDDCEASYELDPNAKLFRTEVDKEMAEFLNVNDIDTNMKPLVHRDGAVPHWGKAVVQDEG